MSIPKIGLALGEGGARGLAHIGVLQVLQESGYKIDQLAGTSIGAVIGAMFSETLDALEIKNRFERLINSDLYKNSGFYRLSKHTEREVRFWDQITTKIKERLALNLAQSKISLFKTDRFREALQMLIKAQSFNQCQVPFITVATDLLKGREVPLCSGSIIQAVLASASIPGYFPPLSYQDLMLADGAICCPVPIHYATCHEPSIVIGVAVSPNLEDPKPLDNAVEIMIRAEEINMSYLSKHIMSKADVQIYPDTKDVEWNEFERLEEMLESGRQAAQEALPLIKEALRSKSPWWKKGFLNFKNA